MLLPVTADDNKHEEDAQHAVVEDVDGNTANVSTRAVPGRG